MTPTTRPSRRSTVLALAAATLAVAGVATAFGGCAASGPAAATPQAPTTVATAAVTPPSVPTAPTTVPTAAPSSTPFVAPAAPGPSGPRPATGREFVRTGPRGPGELVVENGTEHDGYVTLSRDGRARVAVYVRAGATTRVRGVADGTYVLFFATGDGWNGPLRAFTSAATVQRFDDTFPFRTDSDSSTEWTVSLHTVPGGTASSSPVDPAAVPR